MKFFTTPNSKNIISMLRIVTTEKLNWVEIPSYIIFLCVNVVQLHLGNYPRKILPRTITPKQFLPGQLPTGEWSTLWNYLQDSCPRSFATLPGQLPTIKPSLLRNYWEVFRAESYFEFELHLNETSITTVDPSRAGIVKPLLEFWPFCTFFQRCFVTKLRNLNEIFLSLVHNSFLEALAADYLHKHFKHIYLKCSNVVVSYKVNIQWQRSRSLGNMLKTPMSGVPWGLLNK